MKNYLLIIALALASFSASACWYNLNGYSDYIDSVNDQKVAIIADITHGYQTSTHFKIKNNNTVDFPLTVTAKLISNQVISDGERGTKPEILRCKLQYAVLSKTDTELYHNWHWRCDENERLAYKLNNFYGEEQAARVEDEDKYPQMLLSNHISNPFYVDGIPYVTNPYGTIELGFGVERRTDGVWFNVFPTKISVYRQNISQWVTVAEYNVPTGTIPESEPPKTYFGKNNIMPVGCKEGDVIFIRLYVTDGAWQSGDLNAKCDALIQQVQYQGITIQSLPDFEYTTLQYGDAPQLGGGWTPATCIAVVYSGNVRPIK